MLIYIAAIFALICFWVALKEFGKAIGMLVGLVLGIVLIVAVAGLLWQLAVWVFPYVVGCGAIVGVGWLIAKAVQSK